MNLPLAGSPIRVRMDATWLLGFLRPRAVPGVEVIAGQTYARTLRIGAQLHVLTITGTHRDLAAHISPAVPRELLRQIVRVITGTGTRLATFRAHVAHDAVLGPLVARQQGVRLVRFFDSFEGVVRAILGQQVSLSAASTMAARLAAQLGEPVPDTIHPLLRAFPTAHAVAQVEMTSLRSIGLTRARAASLQAVALAIAEGRLDLEQLAHSPGPAADAALRALPGIGPWTAAYIRMRVLGDADAFPASDLGVLKALQRILGVDRVSARQAEALSQAWRPWRALAAIHLWDSLN
jgi:3-methyladenine DNA glycosylase/8-oxoguanine DNA glycosylase